MAAETGISSTNGAAAAARARAAAPLARGYTAPGGPRKSPARRRSPRNRSPAASDDGLAPHPQNPRRRSQTPTMQPPGWARAVLRTALAADPAHPNRPANSIPNPRRIPAVQAVPGARLRRGDVVRAAVRLVRARQVPDPVLRDQRVPAALVALLVDDDVFSAPADRVSVVAAIHAIASQRDSREDLVAAGALYALVAAAREADARARELMLKGEVERGPVWTAAVRTVAKLVVCSTSACAIAIPSGALALLARAAAPEEDLDVRVRAAAGLAAIAAWSGPRRAVAIVETPGVVRAMSALLTERDDMVSNHLRSATMDGLVAMSFHRRARRILREHGCDGKVTAAARHASMSGDYDIAARGTVAAGKLTGRSVDEFGFFVQASGESQDIAEDDDIIVESEDLTGLKRIQELLLHEAYMQVEEIDALEMIVAEDARSGASSPRERQLVRDAARMYGVDADVVAAKLPLERAGSPTSPTETSSRHTSRDDLRKKSSLELPSTKSSASAASSTRTRSKGSTPRDQSHSSSHASSRESSQESSQESSRASTGDADVIPDVTPPDGGPANSGAVRRSRTSSSGTAEIADPDDEPVFDSPEESADERSSGRRSRVMSPLMMFSMGTKKAAELDGSNLRMRKSASQLNRDVEHERVWRDVLDNQPELLKRGTGTMRRVKGYRDLAVVPVPSPLRRTLWPLLLDVAELRNAEPGLYAGLCKRGEEEALSDETEHTIDADVTRTMPLHALFWAGGAQVGVRSLRSILRAYARYRPDVGYCQGMSSVAAVFMMNARDEEDAFLMFVQFMEKFQYKRVFAEGFPQMLEWLEELRPLIYHYMPDLWQRLQRENVPLELYSDKWLITALSHNFPHRYLLRIWDLMFLGGSPKIILKACLAVLKSCESRLLTMEFEGMMSLLQRDFAKPETGLLDLKNPEPFIAMARDFRFVANPNKPPPPTTAAEASAPSAPEPHQQPRHRSGLRACFCFGRSQTID